MDSYVWYYFVNFVNSNTTSSFFTVRRNLILPIFIQLFRGSQSHPIANHILFIRLYCSGRLGLIWVIRLGRYDLRDKANIEDSQFMNTEKKEKLVHSAVPSIFSIPSAPQRLWSNPDQRAVIVKRSLVNTGTSCTLQVAKRPRLMSSDEHSYCKQHELLSSWIANTKASPQKRILLRTQPLELRTPYPRTYAPISDEAITNITNITSSSVSPTFKPLSLFRNSFLLHLKTYLFSLPPPPPQ